MRTKAWDGDMWSKSEFKFVTGKDDSDPKNVIGQAMNVLRHNPEYKRGTITVSHDEARAFNCWMLTVTYYWDKAEDQVAILDAYKNIGPLLTNQGIEYDIKHFD